MSNNKSGSSDHSPHSKHHGPLRNEAAVELVRDRIRQLYGQETHGSKKTLLERFKEEHKDHPDKEAAWNQFYARLTPDEQQQLWDEYHGVTSKTEDAGNKPGIIHPEPPKTFTDPEPEKTTQSIADVKKKIAKKVREPNSRVQGFWARNGKALLMACLVMFILLFANYNQIFIAQIKQFVSPGNSLNSPIIVDPNADIKIGDESRIIIPKINVDVPVVYDIKTYDESAIQSGLERGVVHYANTSTPGKAGNNVIVGHSSNNFFNSGKYKFAFVLLEKLELGDTFILHYSGVRYVYKVTKKQIIEPTDFSLIQPTATPTTTLITCTPPGTSWHRLVIQGEQISPTPTKEKPSTTAVKPDGENQLVPGNSPSLWDRFWSWVTSLFGD